MTLEELDDLIEGVTLGDVTIDPATPPLPELREPLVEFRVADRTGQVTAKYWGGDDRARVESLHDSLSKGDVVRIVGEVSEFKSQLEISISEKNGGIVEHLSDGDYDISGLLKTLDGIQEMKDRLLVFARSVEEPHVSMLLKSFFEHDESARGCPGG